MKAILQQLVRLVGSIGVNGRWHDSHEKGTRKGNVNGFEVTNDLAKLGTVLLNVVHDVYG